MTDGSRSSRPHPLDPPLSHADFEPPHLQNFEAQVAGHPATVFSIRGGRVLLKRSLPAEIKFYYEHLNPGADSIAGSQGLVALTPRCHGAVALSEAEDNKKAKAVGKQLPEPVIMTAPLMPQLVDLNPPIDGEALSSTVSQANAIVLENILHGFVQPNVLDIKLGTQLWDEDATPEKRERMIKAANTCTSAEYGVRLTGWQLWDNARQRRFNVSKVFGKSILKQHELELGARIFFNSPRHPSDAVAFSSVVQSDAPRDQDDVDRLPSLPPELIHRLVTSGLAPQLRQIYDIVRKVEWRVRGGSVLLVYEGDRAALERKLRDAPGDPSTYCSARLIDFAHASFVPGQGPDDGYVLGLQTAISLLDHVAAETGPSRASP